MIHGPASHAVEINGHAQPVGIRSHCAVIPGSSCNEIPCHPVINMPAHPYMFIDALDQFVHPLPLRFAGVHPEAFPRQNIRIPGQYTEKSNEMSVCRLFSCIDIIAILLDGNETFPGCFFIYATLFGDRQTMLAKTGSRLLVSHRRQHRPSPLLPELEAVKIRVATNQVLDYGMPISNVPWMVKTYTVPFFTIGIHLGELFKSRYGTSDHIRLQDPCIHLHAAWAVLQPPVHPGYHGQHILH